MQAGDRVRMRTNTELPDGWTRSLSSDPLGRTGDVVDIYPHDPGTPDDPRTATVAVLWDNGERSTEFPWCVIEVD